MEIKRSGSQPSNKGPADWFTGTVRIDPLFQASDPARTPPVDVMSHRVGGSAGRHAGELHDPSFGPGPQQVRGPLAAQGPSKITDDPK